MVNRMIACAAVIAVTATIAVWLIAMPNDPARALRDGAGSAILATAVVALVIRRDHWLT
ncbi:hypothetical protein OPKNFCMD_2274 [Methylobacterium crusticola]|uniref:Uncharacterized protein n=1 Tax=Methylobacterium crusticola TaxID=1697972 RepID=A0ABQ4QW01_9HYPH|nr:hypothetical protein [Methylobacterium crusticola]GJD49543.1 hypothetical protein OPKNFCMD_2274 [Methylobacterium crusticola]